MNKVITFSVNAYNVENTLEQLLESLVADPSIFDFMEVLIINDGSTDGTEIIGFNYSEKYPEVIKIINKQNGGLGSAINRGIQEAKGKYFKPVDGDDWINSEDLKRIINYMEKAESDMILCDYKCCYEDNRKEKIVHEFTGLENGKNYQLDEMLEVVNYMGYHAIFYKTSVLQGNNIKLDEHAFYVDTELDLYPIPFVKTVSYIDCCIYCYRLGTDGQSVSRESRIKNIGHARSVCYHLMKFFMDNKDKVTAKTAEYIKWRTACMICFYVRALLLFSPSKKIVAEIRGVKKNAIEIDRSILDYTKKRSKTVYLLFKEILLFYIPLSIHEKKKYIS